MVLDAVLSYLHYIAIFLLFAFMTVEVILMRGTLDLERVLLLGRYDIWYFGAAGAALFTGFLRLGLGAKGASFYTDHWPLYGKIGLFVVVGLLSVKPTLAFIRWKRMMEKDPAWRVPDDERRSIRRILMAEVHLAALIPVFAVIMARGIGR
jgi:putative membrane protein